MTRRFEWWIALSVLLSPVAAAAAAPQLSLGPKPSFGLFQPRVTVDISTEEGGTSFGPDANTFLLDTAANGILIFPPATDQLAANGFVNEGTYEEAGISGTSVLDVSAPYHLSYVGTDTSPQTIDDVRFLSGATPVDPTGLMGLNGIVGVRGMVGKVTTLDNRTREGAPSLSMGVSFSDYVPEASTQRFTIPFHKSVFELEGDTGPFPTWSEALPSVTINSDNGNTSSTNSLIFDTGAQLTIISEAMANQLNLDTNQNGDFSDEAIAMVPISGATGSISAPVLVVDRMSLPTEQGFELSWTNAEVIVLDIDPRITGVLGADFITGDGGLDLSFLGGGTGGVVGIGDLLGGGGLGDLFGGTGGLGDLFGGGTGGLNDLLGGFGDLLGGDLLGGGLGGGLGGLEDLLGGGSGGLGGFGDLLGGGLGGGLGGLEDLLGGGLGSGLGGTDLFAAFPLESNFDRVHIDLVDFESGQGQLILDVNADISENILNGDHVFDVRDIDDLTAAIGSADTRFDLDDDGLVGLSDRQILVGDIFRTVAGDADLDKDVDFADFLAVSNGFGQAAGWSGGDFDGDGVTQFADFLLLSTNFGGSEVAAVPEPSAGSLAILAGGALLLLDRERRTAV